MSRGRKCRVNKSKGDSPSSSVFLLFSLLSFFTFPAQLADSVHFNRDHDRQTLSHAAVVCDHGQDVVVASLVVQRFRVADGA